MNRQDLAIIATTAIGASSTIVARELLLTTSPLMLVFIRFTCAAILFFFIQRKVIVNSLAASWKAGAVIGAGFGLGGILLYIGMQGSASGHAAFLINIEVALVPIITFLCFKTIPKKLERVGMGLAMIGLWIFTNPQQGMFHFSDAVLILSACAYAVYTIALSHFGKRGTMSARIFVAFVTIACIGGAGIIGTENRFGPLISQPWSTYQYLLIFYLVVIATVGRFLGQSWGQMETSATRTTLIFTLEPIITLLLSAHFYGEVFHLHQWIGGIFLLSASVIGALPHAKQNEVVLP